MKRKWLCVVALALAAVLCTGCGVKDENLKSDPLVNPDGTAPVGKTLVAPAPPEDFTLPDNKDILAANGLYYASWVSGEPQPYENSEGKTVDLYDAQLTLVAGKQDRRKGSFRCFRLAGAGTAELRYF